MTGHSPLRYLVLPHTKYKASYAHDILTRNWYQKLVPETGTRKLFLVYQLQDFWYQKDDADEIDAVVRWQ